jgi:hypothetical protein
MNGKRYAWKTLELIKTRDTLIAEMQPDLARSLTTPWRMSIGVHNAAKN